MRLIILILSIAFCITLFSLSPLPYSYPVPLSIQETIGSPILPPISANWVATDGAGRTLPTHASTGDYKFNKYVGVFYFLLHGQYQDKAVYDITALTKANPTNPKYGPETAWHWWGEPEAGYFMADDPWVIRRNLQLLTLAGVDILFLMQPTRIPICQLLKSSAKYP